jgi:hypothetical protein
MSQVRLEAISNIPTQLISLDIFSTSARDALVTGEMMKSILLSCPLLGRMNLCVVLDIKLYESLALYGDSITDLYISLSVLQSTKNQSFDPNSSILGNTKLQRKRRRIMHHISVSVALDLPSMSKFLSSFGTIQSLSIQWKSASSPQWQDIGNTLPSYRARHVFLSVNSPSSTSAYRIFVSNVNNGCMLCDRKPEYSRPCNTSR